MAPKNNYYIMPFRLFFKQFVRTAARRLPTDATMHNAQRVLQGASINQTAEDFRRLDRDPSGINLTVVAFDFISLVPGGRILTPLNAWRVAAGLGARRGRPVAGQRIINTAMHATQLQNPTAAATHVANALRPDDSANPPPSVISTLARQLESASIDFELLDDPSKAAPPSGGHSLLFPFFELSMDVSVIRTRGLVHCLSCNRIAMIGTRAEIFARLTSQNPATLDRCDSCSNTNVPVLINFI